MQKKVYLLWWILFVNILDIIVTYYAFHNELPVKEIGPLGASNSALIFGSLFNLFVISLCYYIVKTYKKTKALMFRIFSGLILFWAVFDTAVIINNFWVILQVLRG
jgi:hypothetical protein